MQLTGQAVKHETFGKGVVTGVTGNVITVCFSQGEKRFMYPDAFEHFLTLRDKTAEHKILGVLDKKKETEQAQTQAVLEEQERLQRLQNFKITVNSMAVFDLDHLDGAPMDSWSVSTGVYLSGYSKGMPRIPERMTPNSVCLLTRRPEGKPEDDRQIVGLFMVPEDFFGTECTNGLIRAHETYRIRLPQGRTLPFWDYFDPFKQKPRWGNVAFKYFSNLVMERILFDLRDQSTGTAQEQITADFYQYYCKVNRLPARLPAENA